MKALFRNIVLTLALLASAVGSTEVQTYLMNALKPTEQKYFYPYGGQQGTPDGVRGGRWKNGSTT